MNRRIQTQNVVAGTNGKLAFFWTRFAAGVREAYGMWFAEEVSRG